jgi:hypothetical protein
VAKPSISELLSAPSLLKTAIQADATRVGEVPGVKGKHLRDSYRDWKKANREQQKADLDFYAISRLPKKEQNEAILRAASYFMGANVSPRAIAPKIINVAKIDPGRIVGSLKSAITKVPIQKGAYQSALARLTPPTGQGVAAQSAMSALVGPSFSLSQRYPMPPRDSSTSSIFDTGDALLNRGGDEYDDVVRKWYSLVSNDAFNVGDVDDKLNTSGMLLSAQKILARVAQQADNLRGQPRFEDKITPRELRESLDMASLVYKNSYRPISAADASMKNLRNPLFITTDSGEVKLNNIYAPIKQAPHDLWGGPRWNPYKSIDEANNEAARSLWRTINPPAEPIAPEPGQFVKMAGSGKEYYVEDVLSNPEWKNWSSAHVKPLKSKEYLQGLNSQEFIDKLNQNIAALNKSGAKYTVSPSSMNGVYWKPEINVTYADGYTATGIPYFTIRPGAVDIPTGLEGLPEELKVASYFDGSYPGLNATNTIMGGILNPSETGGGTHFYEALAKTLRETGKGSLRDGMNSKTEHSLAVWEKIKPEKGFSFYHRGKKGLVGGGFNSGVPLIPGLLGLMGQKEERDGSSDN